MSKYHAKKVQLDGLTFDSHLEAERWTELKYLERAGEIDNLQRQVKFILQDPFVKNGKKYRGISYVADFVYYDKVRGEIIVEDTKGFKTDVYRLKRKMFEKLYPGLTITEVRNEDWRRVKTTAGRKKTNAKTGA